LAIISVNERSVADRYTNSQLRYAIIYVLVTSIALVILNIYCSGISRELFYKSKEAAMIEKCQLAANEISELEIINSSTVADAIAQMGSLKVNRLLVTDHTGLTIYDSTQTVSSRYGLLPEIVCAMEGNDVFSCRYQNGTMQSHAATPVISYGTTLGCVYMMEFDVDQGKLIQSLQNNVLRITLMLELVLVLFSAAFSSTFSRRMRQIMASMRIIQQGDYSHKVKLGGHDELTFLGDEFNDLTERLQTSEQKRHRFVSDASHELKTPLASIKLLTDSILQNDMDIDTVREFVGDIGNEADRLNRMSQKLLSLSRTESQEDGDCEIVFIQPTIEKVIKMLSAIAAANGIDVIQQVTQDCSILIIEDDLYQIIFNLVENGIKYNIPGGKLIITLYREADNAVMQIKDTGVGIPEDSLSHIFERFYRVDKARSRKSGGSGLGLSIVRTMVERNRGEISVRSTVGEGTVFTVIFPVFDTEEDET